MKRGEYSAMRLIGPIGTSFYVEHDDKTYTRSQCGKGAARWRRLAFCSLGSHNSATNFVAAFEKGEVTIVAEDKGDEYEEYKETVYLRSSKDKGIPWKRTYTTPLRYGDPTEEQLNDLFEQMEAKNKI